MECKAIGQRPIGRWLVVALEINCSIRFVWCSSAWGLNYRYVYLNVWLFFFLAGDCIVVASRTGNVNSSSIHSGVGSSSSAAVYGRLVPEEQLAAIGRGLSVINPNAAASIGSHTFCLYLCWNFHDISEKEKKGRCLYYFRCGAQDLRWNYKYDCSLDLESEKKIM